MGSPAFAAGRSASDPHAAPDRDAAAAHVPAALAAETATRHWLAALISALLFSVGHRTRAWLTAGSALLIGVAFALLYQRRRALHRLAWAHAAFNLTVLTNAPPLTAAWSRGILGTIEVRDARED